MFQKDQTLKADLDTQHEIQNDWQRAFKVTEAEFSLRPLKGSYLNKTNPNLGLREESQAGHED